MQLGEGSADPAGGLSRDRARRRPRAPCPKPPRTSGSTSSRCWRAGALNDGAEVGRGRRLAPIAARNPRLRDAVLEDARRAGRATRSWRTRRAAAVLMAMNNVYYRFRHMVGKPAYSQKPARLRMQRHRAARHEQGRLRAVLPGGVARSTAARPASRPTSRSCSKAGSSEEHVHDAVRIAAVVHAAAVALEI